MYCHLIDIRGTLVVLFGSVLPKNVLVYKMATVALTSSKESCGDSELIHSVPTWGKY